jgi:hypothetical protein
VNSPIACLAVYFFAFSELRTGLPDFRGATYQNEEKYTKRQQNMYSNLPLNIRNVHKIYQMAIKNIK